MEHAFLFIVIVLSLEPQFVTEPPCREADAFAIFTGLTSRTTAARGLPGFQLYAPSCDIQTTEGPPYSLSFKRSILLR